MIQAKCDGGLGLAINKSQGKGGRYILDIWGYKICNTWWFISRQDSKEERKLPDVWFGQLAYNAITEIRSAIGKEVLWREDKFSQKSL